MKLALVYDRVNKIGGAEKILLALHQLWPQAPLYTGVYDQQKAKWAKSFQIIPSFLQQVPYSKSKHEWLAWAMPGAFETFNFDNFDVVISITSAEAKGIITKPKTLHLCYLLTPTRYLWSHTHFYQTGNYATNKNFLTKTITPFVFSKLRVWDQVAANRPDHIVAISRTVALRTKKYYRRKVDAVIYPPVKPFKRATNTTGLILPQEYYLIVSRLVPYKRIDLAIDAFNQLGKNLIIVGDGAQKKQLKNMSLDNVKIAGHVSKSQLAHYYQKAQALIFPSEEDFGIVSVEAQFAGKPVIGYAKGGSSETIIPGKTGLLFKKQTSKAIIQAVKNFQTKKFKPLDCRENAKRFSIVKFKADFKSYVEGQWQNHQKKLL